MRRAPRAIGLLLGAAALSGCATELRARAATGNPMAAADPQGAGADSERMAITTRDLGAPRVLFVQSAWFHVVGPDELRFHVALANRFREYADVRRYRARLEDERGPAASATDLLPEAVRRAGRAYETLRVERLGTYRQLSGGRVLHAFSPTALREDAYEHDIFQSRGVFVFRAPGLGRPTRRRLSLVLARPAWALRFTWELAPASPLAVEQGALVVDSGGVVK